MHQNSDDQGLARMYVPARTSQSRWTNKFYMYELLQVIDLLSFFVHWEFGVQHMHILLYVGSLYKLVYTRANIYYVPLDKILKMVMFRRA